MPVHRALVLVLVAGCATEAAATLHTFPGAAATGCQAPPRTGPREGFRHLGSRIAAVLGEPRHRGIDLIASSSSSEQLVEGQAAYGASDKALEGEDVEAFACVAQRWIALGRASTDGDGHFAIQLAGAARLPVGLWDLWLSVAGDRTGTGFLAYVARPGAAVVVTDVDGTLTSSENAIVKTVLLRTDEGVQPGAAAVLQGLAARGYQPIYLTARGNGYTELTRRWLAPHGLPRGPLVHAAGWLTLPGRATLDHKNRALDRLRASELAIAIGIGNRATDIAAYRRAGITADHVWIETPEFRREVAGPIRAGEAIGFASYDELLPRLASTYCVSERSPCAVAAATRPM